MKIFHGDLAIACLGRIRSQITLDIRKGFLIGITDHGNDQSAFRPHSDPDIEVMILNEIIAIEATIDGGASLECAHRGLDEERHKAELHSVLFDKAVLLSGPQIHHCAHVALIKGGENRRGVLRHHQLLGNLSPKWRKFLPRRPVG